MTSNVLPLFWNLSNNDTSHRLDAAEQLVSALDGFQREHAKAATAADVPEYEPGEDNVQQWDSAFETRNAEDVKYSVKRLVRGLASSRDSSRLGFAVALTEILARIAAQPSRPLSATHIISLILRASVTSSGMRGSDERDLLFARLFGLHAIIASNLLVLDAAHGAAGWISCVDALLALGSRKAWIRESAWFTLVRALEGLEASGAAWTDEAVGYLVERVFKGASASNAPEGQQAESRGFPWTQEKVALTIVLQRIRPRLDWQALLAPTFKTGTLLAPPNLKKLGRVLKDAATEVDDEDEGAGAGAAAGGSGTGAWKAQPHFVWDVLLDAYFADGKGRSVPGQVAFQDLFRVLVDDNLLAPDSSASRKYWGFEIFSRALPLLPESEVPLIFTPNFMRTWISQLSGHDRLLHKAAVRVAQQVQAVANGNPNIGFTLLTQLVGRNGSQIFDRLTKTKTVEGILASLKGEAAVKYVSYLKGQFDLAVDAESFDAAELETRREWVMDQMLSLARQPAFIQQDEALWSVLEFLLVHGFYTVSKANKSSDVQSVHSRPKPAVSDKVAEISRRNSLSAIIEVTVASRLVKEDGSEKVKKLQGCDASGRLWLQRCLETVAKLDADVKHVSPAVDVDDEIKALRSEGAKVLKQLAKHSAKNRDMTTGLTMMLSFAILKTYDDDVDAFEVLGDVQSCAKKIIGTDKKTSGASADDLPPIDLLVDTLVGYMDKASGGLRALATSIFGLVSGQVGPSAIEHLVAQLESAPGAGDSDEEVAESDENEDEDMEGSDDDEDEDDASESADDEDIESDDANEDVDPEFRRKVAEALQVSGMAEVDGDESSDEDASDDDDDVSITMDDDQMLQLDEKLAEVFKQQRAGKSGKSATQEAAHFKTRVLDLVDTFIKRQPQHSEVLTFVPVLLRLRMQIGDKDKALTMKAGSVLRNCVNNARELPVVTDLAAAKEMLEEVHDIARGSPSREVSSLCSDCSIFVAKAISHMPSTSKGSVGGDAVAQVYSKTLKDCMTKKGSHIHPSFVGDWIQRQPTQAWALRDEIVEYGRQSKDSGVNDHQQMEALTLAGTLSKHLAVISQTVPVAEVEAWLASARSMLYAILQRQAADDASWQAPRIKDVIKTAMQIARHSKSVLKTEGLAATWDADAAHAIGQALANIERLRNNASVHNLFGQLELLISPAVQAQQAAKRQAKQQAKQQANAKKRQRTEQGEAGAGDQEAVVDSKKAKPNGEAKTPKTKEKKRKVVA